MQCISTTVCFSDAVVWHLLVVLAGALHFLQLPATVFAYRLRFLYWQRDLSRLRVLNRRMVIVMGLGVLIASLGLGVVVIRNSQEIANGSRFGNDLCVFLALFWGFRAAVQAFAYSKSWPKNHLLAKASHYGLLLLLAVLATIYASVFFRGVFALCQLTPTPVGVWFC